MTVKKNNQKTARGANRKAGNTPKLTAEEQRTLLAKQLGIKPKTKEFVDLMLADPKLSATEAYIQVHSTNNRNTAARAASRLLEKPSVIGYKDNAVRKAKRLVVSLVDDDNKNLAFKAAQDILDRTEGKAVQKSENTSQVIHVKLDLAGKRIGAHYVQGQQLPAISE